MHNQNTLIIPVGEDNTGRHGELGKRLLHGLGDRNTVAVWLLVHLEQNGGFAVLIHDRPLGDGSADDLADIADAHYAVGARLHHHIFYVIRMRKDIIG